MSSANSKRHRTPSLNSISSTSTTETLHPSKASRIVPGQSGSAEGVATSHPLVCTLPPTCNHRPTPLASSRDMEIHYATYHAHVCEQGGCGAVFPEARLLELHQTECHDPVAAVRKDRGEKIFACLLATCPRFFSSPKTRRLHLIQTHSYPKEFFFAVTNKGIGGLLKRWGEGASMIRGEWKPRSNANEGKDDDEDDDDQDDDGLEVEDEEPKVDDQSNTGTKGPKKQASKEDGTKSMSIDQALEALTNNMDSLSLVPPSIRFGRGGKKGGFLPSPGRGFNAYDNRGFDGIGHRGRGRGVNRGRGRGGPREMAGMDVDVDTEAGPVAQTATRRGRGGNTVDTPRGRGGPFRGRKFRDDGV